MLRVVCGKVRPGAPEGAGAGGCSQPPQPNLRPFQVLARPPACAARRDAPHSGTEGVPWSTTSSGWPPEDPESCPHKDDAFSAPEPSAPRSHRSLLGRSEIHPQTGDKPGPGGSPGPHTPSCLLHLAGSHSRPSDPSACSRSGQAHPTPALPHTQGGDTGLPRGSQRQPGRDWAALGLPVTFGSSGQMTRCVCGCGLGTSGGTGGHAACRGLRPGQLGRGFSRMRGLG